MVKLSNGSSPRRREEDKMDAKLIAESESLRRTAERLHRVGLIVDRTTLSPAHRRAMFALQCNLVDDEEPSDSTEPKIGFRYPNAR
jgi:hypothetical protein